MEPTQLQALSPLDGRYAHVTQPLALVFSESSLITQRIQIELKYLQALAKAKIIRSLTKAEISLCTKLEKPSLPAIQRVKQIEQKIHHDVKAVEYLLAEKFQSTSLKDCIPYIHLGLTSEDINNLAYRLMINQAQQEIILPQLTVLLKILTQLAQENSQLPMLARTHGQAAVPTTLGKEFSVFAHRLLEQLIKIDNYQLTGKLNGAVGAFQALHSLKPTYDWPKFSQQFVTGLGLKPNPHTTQINPADDLVGLFCLYHLVNSILIDLNQDCWRYISDNWLVQIGKADDVGSSTMPQKINPIEFENSEGNLVLANGLIETIARKLPISRLQRDLSDSTINRNLGSIFGYCLIGYTSLSKGLLSIKPNPTQINLDLNQNFAILSEALQTHLRFQQNPQAYEQVAKQVKNQVLTKSDWQNLTNPLVPQLANLTPQDYTGLASHLTQDVIKKVKRYLARKKR